MTESIFIIKSQKSDLNNNNLPANSSTITLQGSNFFFPTLIQFFFVLPNKLSIKKGPTKFV